MQIRKLNSFLKNMRADWLTWCFPYIDRDTQLVQTVDMIKARTTRIYILIIKVNKLGFLAFVAVFSKRNRKRVLRVYLELSKRSVKAVCENSRKLSKHSRVGLCYHRGACSPNLPLERNMEHVLYLLITATD